MPEHTHMSINTTCSLALLPRWLKNLSVFWYVFYLFFIDFSVIVTPYITKAIPIQYHFNNNSGHILPSVILIFYLHIEVFNHHDQTTKT
jgi:hypothetical protein